MFNDGSHIIYVNGKYNGSDKIGKLMHDFRCKKASEMNYDTLADRVRYFKEDEGGREMMCKLVENLCEETVIERGKKTVKYLLSSTELSTKKIAEATGFSISEIDNIKKNLDKNKKS